MSTAELVLDEVAAVAYRQYSELHPESQIGGGKPYIELSESEKEVFREWAHLYLEVFANRVGKILLNIDNLLKEGQSQMAMDLLGDLTKTLDPREYNQGEQ